MPLPTGDQDWPPPNLADAYKLMRRWGAWYAGDPDELATVYADTIATGVLPDPKALNNVTNSYGGQRGQITRMWWGQPQIPGGLREAKLHIPLASDIAVTSADLLFSEPPAIVAPEDEDASEETQTRLDFYMAEGGAHSVMAEAAEICAALGGVYLRTGWDLEVADHPIFDAVPPDAAVPVWRSGHLTAVTFWREVRRDGGHVWRHLEHHDPGTIWHALYRGSDDKLGIRVDLREHPETEPFAQLVDGSGRVDTGTTGLCVQYIPNMRPNRVLRGSPLGRSDYSGIEPLLDALDEAWSSWMRDLRLGKARLVVPDVYLHNDGRGKGAHFDPEQAIFTSLNSLPPAEGLSIEQVQFAIRVVEHRDTCNELATQALRGAGYSTQTFGESGDVAVTATEVHARERRSYTTRARKINYWRAPLIALFRTALEIDLAQFKPDKVSSILPAIEWADGVTPDPEALARTLQMLHAAEAVSLRTKVAMLHPDWDTDQVDEEVEEIRGDLEAANPVMPDPLAEDGAPVPAGGPPKPAVEKPPAKVDAKK